MALTDYSGATSMISCLGFRLSDKPNMTALILQNISVQIVGMPVSLNTYDVRPAARAAWGFWMASARLRM